MPGGKTPVSGVVPVRNLHLPRLPCTLQWCNYKFTPLLQRLQNMAIDSLQAVVIHENRSLIESNVNG